MNYQPSTTIFSQR